MPEKHLDFFTAYILDRNPLSISVYKSRYVLMDYERTLARPY